MSPAPKNYGSTTKRSVGSTIKLGNKSRDLLSGDEQRVKWKTTWRPSLVSRLSDADLAAGKAAFFSMDRDSSGSIDEDELLQALRGLGHSLKRDQAKSMIAEVEGENGDGDGKISIREFLAWYARCLQLTPNTDKDQVNDAFSSLGGAEGKLAKAVLKKLLYDQFELEVDVDEAFETPAKDGDLKYDDFAKLLEKQPA
jgi:Ca2+-binding EF-hand superfamily protein